jgi:hypothetical protein
MPQGRRDLRQETKSMVIIQLDSMKKRKASKKGSRNFSYGDNSVWEFGTISLTPLLNFVNLSC